MDKHLNDLEQSPPVTLKNAHTFSVCHTVFIPRFYLLVFIFIHLPLCYLLHTKLPLRDLLVETPEIKLGSVNASVLLVSACTYLGLQRMQQRENGKESTQSVSHMLLHHLPPNAQTDESHQAERLETDGGASLHPAGEPEYSRVSTTKQGMNVTSIEEHFLIIFLAQT